MKKIHGWNDIPTGYVQEEDFHLAPIWLRLLASLKYFEKYAYPVAVKRGLIKRWKIQPDESGPEFSWNEGIKYINAPYPGFSYGNPIEIQMRKSKVRLSNFSIKLLALLGFFKSILMAIIIGLFSTKWSRNRKTSYVKAKIAAAKSKY